MKSLFALLAAFGCILTLSAAPLGDKALTSRGAVCKNGEFSLVRQQISGAHSIEFRIPAEKFAADKVLTFEYKYIPSVPDDLRVRLHNGKSWAAGKSQKAVKEWTRATVPFSTFHFWDIKPHRAANEKDVFTGLQFYGFSRAAKYDLVIQVRNIEIKTVDKK